MNAQEREELIKTVEQQKGKRFKVLKELGIPRQTYYQWRKDYQERGITGLAKDSTVAKRIWNRLTPQEKERIIAFARQHPELSPRLLAIELTDEGHFSVSEPTVYRLLKQAGLISPMPLPEMPAAREWKHKTTKPDEIWQCDGTKLFIVGWGYYSLVPVLDDYSRKILAGMLKADESGFSVSDAVEQAVENARKENHIINEAPKLYSDNGSGFISGVLNEYLCAHGIKHIFGTPYHPQGRGKIERFNRTIKEKLCLLVYCSPDELQEAINYAIAVYNSTPHESLQNVSPNDVYAGQKEVILAARQEKKRLTIERRRMYNLGIPQHPNQPQTLQSEKEIVSNKG